MRCAWLVAGMAWKNVLLTHQPFTSHPLQNRWLEIDLLVTKLCVRFTATEVGLAGFTISYLTLVKITLELRYLIFVFPPSRPWFCQTMHHKKHRSYCMDYEWSFYLWIIWVYSTDVLKVKVSFKRSLIADALLLFWNFCFYQYVFHWWDNLAFGWA